MLGEAERAVEEDAWDRVGEKATNEVPLKNGLAEQHLPGQGADGVAIGRANDGDDGDEYFSASGISSHALGGRGGGEPSKRRRSSYTVDEVSVCRRLPASAMLAVLTISRNDVRMQRTNTTSDIGSV